MRPVVIGRLKWFVGLMVGLSIVSHAKTDGAIEMSFGIWTPECRRNHELDVGAYWHHLANAAEPSMCAGNAALCEITLTACYCLYRSV